VLHAWKLAALRAAFLARGGPKPPLVVSAADVTREPGELTQRVDRWLLKRADRVLATGPAEASRCREQGAVEAAIQIVLPGVLPMATERPDLPELPPTARVVLC